MPLDPLSLGAGVLQSGYGLYEAINAGKKEKDIAEKEKALELSRPKYNISDVAKKEQSLAESNLANGMSAQAETAYNRSTDKDLSTSISALLKSGGSANSISELFDKSQEGRSRLAIMKENERMQNLNSLVSSYRNMQEQGDKAFQINEEDPYRNQAAALSASMMAAEGQKQAGLSAITGGAMNAVSGVQNQLNYDKYFKLIGGDKGTSGGLGTFPESGISEAMKGLQNIGGMKDLATSLNNTNDKYRNFDLNGVGGQQPTGIGELAPIQQNYSNNQFGQLGSLMTNPAKVNFSQDFFLK